MSPAVREVRMRRAACLLVTVLCVLLFLAAPAHAAFPGLDGKLAFEASNNRQHDIYAVNPDGSGQANLTQSPEDDYSPAWSADGRKIAFTRASPYPPGGNSHIWVMNSDGSLQIDLIPLMSGDSAGPAWSPDGSKIAFANIDCPVYPDNGLCISDLYTMNANGTGQTKLTTPKYSADFGGERTNVTNQDPAWSPDGSWIAFDGFDFATDRAESIYKIRPDGTGLTKVFSGEHGAAIPNWSPDGSRIAFGYGSEIATINPDGTGLKVLTDHPTTPGFPPTVSDIFPAWSPDGTKIVFETADSNTPSFRLYVINSSDGSGKTFLTNGFDPDWQPIPGPQRADYRNAAKFCEANRAFLGDATFGQKYGTSRNGANAFGKCVSSS